MAKIAFDKYYTPPITARWCIDKVKEIIGEENITEWVEPSAGSGSFSHQILGCKAYDLYPQHEYIEQVDFLELDLGGHKKGRCFIGNPPFGGGSGLLLKSFYDKCCDNGDYIAFIQPPSYYNNYTRFNKFEIVYSCIIETPYTNHNLKTSFTIYKRNDNKDRFENIDYTIPFIKYTKYAKSNKKNNNKIKNHHYSFNNYGHSIMKQVKPYENVSCLSLDINDDEYISEIIYLLKWIYDKNKSDNFLRQTHISMSSIDKNVINRLIRICIPEINKKYPIK
jgi:hypothetical protein